jgi:hypothetical protein
MADHGRWLDGVFGVSWPKVVEEVAIFSYGGCKAEPLIAAPMGDHAVIAMWNNHPDREIA